VLTACAGAVFAGGMALRAQPGDQPPAAPITAANDRRADNGDDTAGTRRFQETTRKELDSLRTRVDALERKLPTPERQKIVVTNPLAKDIAVAQQYVGKIRAHRHINISALASGVISEVAIKEGQAVKKGDTLFRVVPTLSQAKLDAELAEVKIAQLEFNNTKRLFEQKVVSQLEMALHEAKLAKAEAKAKLAATELKLTVVQAPFDGLVGRLQLQEGSAVKEGSTLTTLSDNSAVWVYFNVPEARYLEYMANPGSRTEAMPIELVLANGSKFPQTGKLGAIEGQFDNDTGAIPFRADFPNPKGLLRHGQTGTVVIREPLKHAIVIPQRATFEERNKRYVYAVGEDGVAHRREIVVQGETENLFIVKQGLDASDRIVVDGIRLVHDGEKLAGYEYRKPEEVIDNPKPPGGR
jgi:membrane fusion protein (multidrug efflux system)